MNLPFTEEQFFDVFGAYNSQQWPLIAVAWLAVVATILQMFRGGVTLRWLVRLTAIQWAWTAAVYHAVYFSRINPAAWLFAALFLIEAYGLWRFANVAPPLWIRAPLGPRQAIGSALMIYAVLYPGLVMLAGTTLPRAPLFAVPCPLAIFTLGVLVAGGSAFPARLALIPVGWAIVGTSAAVSFGVTADFALAVAALVLVIARVRATRRPAQIAAP